MTQPLRDITPPTNPPPRISSRVFPPYRHVPGLHPHPVANPAGHSYNPTGEHPVAEPLLTPAEWAASDDYRFGVDLYNYGYWWEAHEAWEGLWQQTDKSGVQGRFLQGLIQVSAAHLKRHVDQPEGVDRLLERAFSHLDCVLHTLKPGEHYMGLDLHRWVAEVKQCFSTNPTQFPFIVLSTK